MGLTNIQLPAETNPPVLIAKADLSALVVGSTLVPYTTYIITDAQDALGGTVSVYATSINTLDTNGSWDFVAKLPAQGRFKLLTGAAGSVDSITVNMPTVGVINILTAVIPFNTSRNQTATDVVANINANTLVSNCRAWVTTSTTSAGNFDTPIIHIEALNTTTGFAHTMVVSLTILTISGQVNPTLGFTESTISLESKYDLTNDRILSAYDRLRDCLVTSSVGKIVSLGLNSVTTYRWNDPRLISIKLIDSLWQNIAIRVATTSNIPRWRNITFSNMSLQQVTFSTNQMLDVVVTGGINNLNSLIGVSIARSNCYVDVSAMDVSSLSIDGCTDNSISIYNSTFGTAATNSTLTFTLNTSNINMNTVAVTATTANALSDNKGSTISISNGSISRITILNNNLQAPLDIINPAITPRLRIERNIINGYVSFNAVTISGGADVQLTESTIGQLIGLSVGLKFDNSIFSTFKVSGCDIINLDVPTGQTIGNFSLLSSTIHNVIFPVVTTGTYLLIDRCIITDSNLIGLSDDTIAATGVGSNIVTSEIRDSNITDDGTTLVYFTLFDCSNTKIINSTIVPAATLTGSTSTYYQLSITNSRILHCNDVQLSNEVIDSPFIMSGCVIENCPQFWAGNYGDESSSGQSIMTDCTIKNSIYKVFGTTGYQVIKLVVEYSTVSMFHLAFGTFVSSLYIADAKFSSCDIQLSTATSAETVTFTSSKFDSWIYGDTALATNLTCYNLSITDGKVYYYSGPILLGSSPVFLTTIPKGFTFKKTTYISDALVAAGSNLKVGYNVPSANDNDYFDLAPATINAAQVGEFGTMLPQLTADQVVQLSYDTAGSAGNISFVIEGVLTYIV